MEHTRLRQLRKLIAESFGGSQSALSARTGVSLAQLGQYLAGYRNMGEKTARKIEQGAGKPLGWLDDLEANVEDLALRGRVPLISWVAAGSWSNVNDPYVVGDAEDWLACPVKHSSKTFALRVKGDSMFNPGGSLSFQDGDIIFVDPERAAGHRSLVVVRLEDENSATFKRLLIDDDKRMLEALNPAWPNRIFQINGNATVCGVVIARMESFV